MLRRVRAHTQGLRFYDALSNSPLTIVYQCIGNVKAAQLEDTLRAEISESKDSLSAVPTSFRIKNSLASATGRPDVATFLQATNVLVGWDLRAKETPSAAAPQVGHSAVREADRLSQLVAVASANAAASRQGPQRQPPQRTLALLIKASLRLAEKYPIAPLAGFFHGQRIGLADLSRWGELDDATVYGELLMHLESVPRGLVESISVYDMGISGLLDAQASPLLACLDARRPDTPANTDTAAAASPSAA